MKKLIGSIVAVAGLAAAAGAQPITQLCYEARVFNAGNNTGWGASVNALPGDTIEVRAVVSLLNGGAIAGGLKQIVFQPVVTGWTGADALVTQDIDGAGSSTSQGVGVIGGARSTPQNPGVADVPGAYGRLTPWVANATTTSTFLRGHVGTGTAAGMLRIAQNHITNWIGAGATSGSTANNNFNGGGGVSVAQIAVPSRIGTDPAPSLGQTGLIVFKFAFVLSGSTDVRSLTVDTPQNGLGRTLVNGVYVDNIQWFNSPTSGDADFTRMGGETCAATVNIVPTPATLALMGLGGLVAGRRRR
ncbi:MAG: PEP-CTERM sorting domain-containing protein [Leptolyngbya sp. PLA1]|nr:PEP-CTERM sorting domain-containing protein [Leptolyngbya sp. PLA1]